MTPSVIIIPVLNNLEQSVRAITSAQHQDGVDPLQILVIDQGSELQTRRRLEAMWPFQLWQHNPPLPSLAATWNRALEFAWEIGAQDALVINNDVELVPTYYRWLRERLERDGLWFLSGVGVTSGMYHDFTQTACPENYDHMEESFQLHPDFSAYLITRTCHEKYPFDENFVPAYTEDVDLHRRMLIGRDGRKIGKINLPFLHHASGTLKSLSPEANARLSAQIGAGSRAYFARKWGGPVNEERFLNPFGAHEPHGGASCTATQDLRRQCEEGRGPYGDTQSDPYEAEVQRILGKVGHGATDAVRYSERSVGGSSQESTNGASES